MVRATFHRLHECPAFHVRNEGSWKGAQAVTVFAAAHKAVHSDDTAHYATTLPGSSFLPGQLRMAAVKAGLAVIEATSEDSGYR